MYPKRKAKSDRERFLESFKKKVGCAPEVYVRRKLAAGMNEEESAKLSEFIREIRDKKDVTVVIIDHHMDVIMAICDQISVLNFGTLLAEGRPEEIQNNPDVISAYLGVDE